MPFIELIQIALEALLSNKLRTFLTALGIIIGTGSVIAMIAIGNGAQASIASRITSMGTNTLTIRSGSSQSGLVSGGSGSSTSLVADDYYSLLEKLDKKNITGISPVQSGNYQVIYKENNTNVSVSAVAPDYFSTNNYTLSDGSKFNEIQNENAANVAVIGSDTATDLFGTDSPVNKQIQIKNQIFTIIGLLTTKGSSGPMSQDDLILIPFETGRRNLSGKSTLQSIVVQADKSDNVTTVQDELNLAMLEIHQKTSDTADFTISNSQQMLETLSSITSTFTVLLAGIAGISLLVGGIGIMNTMIISITERTKEIGLRKAIGAKDNLILMQFVVESVVLSGLGAIFGIVLGVSIAMILSMLNVITTSITAESIILSASISMIIGLVFGIYPARRAAKLSPIDALKYE